MAEKSAIAAVWDEKVGHTKITNLQVPTGITESPRGTDGHLGTTGLYCRAYNKVAKEHQFHLLLYTLDQLEEHTSGGATAHLRALKKFTADYGWKMSFCLGFAIADDGVVKRNSCSNVQVTGQRTMPDEWYDQLVPLLQGAGFSCSSDMDELTSMFAANKVK